MKFAFILFKYVPFGGMQRNMHAIARACVERQHEVTVICSQWRGERPDYLKVVELPVSAWRGNGAQMQQFCRQFRNYLRSEPHDRVVGFNKFPGLDAYYAADSCFAHKAYQERSWLYRLSPRAQTYLNFEQAVFARDSATKILEVSPRERERFREQYNTPHERFFPLPPGIARDRIAALDHAELRARLRRELNITDTARVFLTVGSGFRTKGLDRSIQLLADWQKNNAERAILLVAGADKPDSFSQQAKRLGVAEEVLFLGGRNDVPALFQAADVVIHPAYRENTGNVLLEAMIAGRPVVATDICGYSHYIDEAHMGEVLASPFSAAHFRAAVERILAVDDCEWRQRGAHFAQREEIYSRPQVAVDLLESFYHPAPSSARLAG